MKKSNVILLKSFSALLALGLTCLLFFGLLFRNIATSLQPGWHTTIIPPKGVLPVIVILLLFIGVVYLAYKLIWRILVKFVL